MHGQMIGSYRKLEQIGAGAQGTVYRAEGPSSGEVVALKVLPPHKANDPSILRFLREAEIAKSIDHRNVVRILEVGQDGDQRFITMEYLPRSVRDIIDVGKPTIAQAIKMCMDAASGLQAASDLGIVHRDIKPDNLLIASDGVVKVSDFGLARDAGLSTITADGAALGTVRYMSPEEALGERADTRSDIYSLGVTLYELLTGSVPFDANTLYGIVQQHIKDNPPPVRRARPEVPVQIERIVSKCLEKDPDRRFQTPGELIFMLARAMVDFIERNALEALYNTTDGANWEENDNWMSNKPLSEWHGVTTDEVGHVTELDLRYNQLSGGIPPEIGNLTELRKLDLRRNHLSGNIPPEIGNLTELRELDLWGNHLISGSIPPEIGNLTELRKLDLSFNNLSGNIPPEIGDLFGLGELDLSFNNLSGNIPPEIGNLTELEELDLSLNDLSGSIPPEIGNLRELRKLDLSNNELSGNIPPEIAYLIFASLTHLDLRDNQIVPPHPDRNEVHNDFYFYI